MKKKKTFQNLKSYLLSLLEPLFQRYADMHSVKFFPAWYCFKKTKWKDLESVTTATECCPILHESLDFQ